MPTFRHGRNTAFKIKDSGGTLRDISNVLTDSNLAQIVEAADVTTYGATRKETIAGLIDGTISLTGILDATVDGYLAGLLGVDPVDFEYYPTGTTTGNVKWAGKAMLTSYDPGGTVGDKVGFSAELQLSGALTRTIV